MKEQNPLEPLAAAGRDAMIDEARVQVLVAFPALTLSVHEANALREGQVIDLGVSLVNAQMTVKVSGEEVCKGRLMVVGTHAGVLLAGVRA
jgi:flagellar motor switch/type III secretory pathway protein FliN